jgi:hypothetical protein
MQQLNRALEGLGELVAGFWLSVAALVMILSFQVCGLVASFFVGVGTAWLVGYGTAGVFAFFVTAFAFGLFLAVYVWEPRVKRAMFDAAEHFNEHRR